MWFVVGLGNPGRKYQLTRHNVGFMAIDFFLNSIGHPPKKKEHQSLTHSLTMEDQKILLAKPQTFMNNSGMAVQALCHYYKINPDRLIVIHDDIEYPFKQLKVHKGRGHGGHNGIRDIHQKLNTNDYYRIRIGVGRPETKGREGPAFSRPSIEPVQSESKSKDNGSKNLSFLKRIYSKKKDDPGKRADKSVNDHVLSNFSKEEQKDLPPLLEKVADGIEGLIFEGLEKTANQLNSKT